MIRQIEDEALAEASIAFGRSSATLLRRETTVRADPDHRHAAHRRRPHLRGDGHGRDLPSRR
jgi:hypothetical protein